MKIKSILITSSLLLLTSAATAAEYTVSGTRYLRKYTAPQKSQVYMAETDAQRVANNLCNVSWDKSETTYATATTHVTTNLDWNVGARESFDAALWCANHVGDEHIAYANAACYVFEFPHGAALPTLTNLEMTVYSDPYNVYGARISVMASDTMDIPTDCATVRGDAAGGIRLAGVCPRVTRTSGGSNYWYPATSNVVFNSSNGLSTPLQLRRYLFVFVLMENYATSRGNWLEGCSWIENAIKIKTSGTISGWTAGCDIAEPYATNFHLKDGHADEDWDGDGLSNYAEYLITHVFRFATLNPDNARSDGTCLDYFRKRNGDQLYFGEMFDGMRGLRGLRSLRGEGEGEGEQRTYSSINLRTTYYGKRRVKAPVVVHAWSTERDAEMTGSPDETFETEAYVVNGDRSAKIADLRSEKSMCLDMGGKYNAVAFADEDCDGKFTPGEPFAYLRGIELGASEIYVQLTDDSPIFPRIDLVTCEYAAKFGVNSVTISNKDEVATTDGRNTRVRVVRAMVDGSPIMGYNQQGHEVPVDKVVVMDKMFDLSARHYLHEGDFLTDGSFDIGWADAQTTVYNRTGDRAVYTGRNNDAYSIPKFIDATNMTYMIVLGDGTIGTGGSNVIHRCMVNRVYDTVAARYKPGNNPAINTIRPVIDTVTPGLVYGARPTFRWAMQDGQAKPSNYNSYTAFKLQIRKGSTVVYDSGYRTTPARDDGGWYGWTLTEPIGTIVSTSGDYTWRVAMFNAKYKDETFWDDKSDEYSYLNGGSSLSVETWSEDGSLVVDVNNQQPMNDHGYSSIAAAVKYAGPSTVISSVGAAGTNRTGRCVVAAYDNENLVGVPAGTCYSKTGLANTSSMATNAVVKGLKQDGTYWLRAFIDQNGNGVPDAWEPCGTAANAVALSKNTIATPKVEIWIEDADTDGDWIPDSYEIATYGSLTNMAASIIGGDLIKFNGNASATGSASISRGLGGASLTTFQNSTLVNALLQGMNNTVSIEAIRVEAEQ